VYIFYIIISKNLPLKSFFSYYSTPAAAAPSSERW